MRDRVVSVNWLTPAVVDTGLGTTCGAADGGAAAALPAPSATAPVAPPTTSAMAPIDLTTRERPVPRRLSDLGGSFRHGQRTIAATRGCRRWSIQILNLVYTFWSKSGLHLFSAHHKTLRAETPGQSQPGKVSR